MRIAADQRKIEGEYYKKPAHSSSPRRSERSVVGISVGSLQWVGSGS